MTVLAAAVAGLAGLGAGVFVIHTTPPAAPSPPSAIVQTPPRNQAPADAGLPPIIAPVPVEAVPVEAAPVAAPPLRHRPRIALAKAPASHEPPARAQPASCERSAVGPGCRRAVIQADRHLRNVYANAVRRGVARGVLVDYRDRWADLREDASDDPAHLIQGYGALAYDLGREARDNEEGAQRRRDPSGLKALASALVPWW